MYAAAQSWLNWVEKRIKDCEKQVLGGKLGHPTYEVTCARIDEARTCRDQLQKLLQQDT